MDMELDKKQNKDLFDLLLIYYLPSYMDVKLPKQYLIVHKIEYYKGDDVKCADSKNAFISS